MPRQRFEPGAVRRMDLDERRHTYARMLSDHPYHAIYDAVTEADLAPDEVVARPVLFVLAVADRAYQRWPKVGEVPLARAPVAIPEFFVQDRFNPQQCRIMDYHGNMRPASPEECVGLEPAAVWDPEHVEQRLRDHLAGQENPHLAHMQVKLV
jgi:hypothetical protein